MQLFIAILAFLFCAGPAFAIELTRDTLMGPLQDAADYLARNQLDDGQFIYIKDPLGRCCKKRDKYSMIRHLGGVYALLRAYEMTPRAEYAKAARLGLDFAARFLDGQTGHRVVKSLSGKANIGENGFLLLDLVWYQRLTGDTAYRPLADELANFVTHSLVYGNSYATPGQWAECQAAMGLLHYHQHLKSDQRYVETVRRFLKAMQAEGRSSHWSVQAVDALLEAVGPKQQTQTDDELYAYALATGKDLLRDVQSGAKRGKLYSCNSTARNEGLLAVYRVALRRGDLGDARFFLEQAREHIAFALQFQYGSATNLLARDPIKNRAAQLFDLRGGVFDNPEDAYVRIDYVAHHARAIAQYLASPHVSVEAGLKWADIDVASPASPQPARP